MYDSSHSYFHVERNSCLVYSILPATLIFHATVDCVGWLSSLHHHLLLLSFLLFKKTTSRAVCAAMGFSMCRWLCLWAVRECVARGVCVCAQCMLLMLYCICFVWAEYFIRQKLKCLTSGFVLLVGLHSLPLFSVACNQRWAPHLIHSTSWWRNDCGPGVWLFGMAMRHKKSHLIVFDNFTSLTRSRRNCLIHFLVDAGASGANGK